MTKIAPDHECDVCGGKLVLPQVFPASDIPASADYVCDTCGRVYYWLGNPPLLTALRVVKLVRR